MSPATSDFEGVLVQKYGGSSVADAREDARTSPAGSSARTRSRAHRRRRVGDGQDDGPADLDGRRSLAEGVAAARWTSSWPPARQIAVSMVGLALQARGVPAVSLTANQCGIQTDGSFNKARVHSVETRRLVARTRSRPHRHRRRLPGRDDRTTRSRRSDAEAATSPAPPSPRRCSASLRELHRRRRRLHRRPAGGPGRAAHASR